MNILSIILILSVLLTSSLTNRQRGFNQIFCNRTLPDSTVAKFESCEQFVSPMLRNSTAKCMQQLKLGTSFGEQRNATCNRASRRQLSECTRIEMRALRKSANGSGNGRADRGNRTQLIKQHEDCIRKAITN